MQLYIKWIKNNVLLHSTRNDIQYSLIDHNREEKIKFMDHSKFVKEKGEIRTHSSKKQSLQKDNAQDNKDGYCMGNNGGDEDVILL